MVKLSDQTLTTIFYLQRRLVELIDEAKAVEFAIFEQFGENEVALPELDQMQIGIAEYQPVALDAMLNLLAQTIQQTEALISAVEASISETKENWNLP